MLHERDPLLSNPWIRRTAVVPRGDAPCGSDRVPVGQYVHVDGQKEHEQFYYTDGVSIAKH